MSISHIIILLFIAVIVIPPDKLPETARQVARFFNQLRRLTGGMWDDIKKETNFKPSDLLKENQPQPSRPAPTPDPNLSTEEKNKHEP